MTAELQQESEFTNEITTQPAPVEEKKETDEDRNWKAFLEKRKEEQRLFDAEKEKNKQLQELDARRQKEIEDLKIAFQVMLEKKEAPDFDDSDQAQKKFVQDEIQRLFKEEPLAHSFIALSYDLYLIWTSFTWLSITFCI